MENKIYIPKGKKLLDPKVDSTFKTLFTREGKSAQIALRELVKTIIGHEPEAVEVINSELPKDIENAKNIRLDLQCRMSDGSRIDLEMQTCMSDDDLKARSLYYGCRMMSSAVKSGVTYRKLPDIYQVMFTNFQLFGNDSSYLEKFMVQNGRFILSEHLQYFFIQMPLVMEAGRGAKNLSDIEKWVIFLRDSTDESKRDLLNEIMSSNEGIREAGEILMTISDDEREWAIQESRLKGELDYQSGMIASHDKGLEEGIEIGEQQGIEKIARGMKAENIPVETIVKITGLTAEQVEAL